MPLARYEGKMNGSCDTTIFPFDPEKLRSLYPSFEIYAAKYGRAVADAEKRGILCGGCEDGNWDSMNRRLSVFPAK